MRHPMSRHPEINRRWLLLGLKLVHALHLLILDLRSIATSGILTHRPLWHLRRWRCLRMRQWRVRLLSLEEFDRRPVCKRWTSGKHWIPWNTLAKVRRAGLRVHEMQMLQLHWCARRRTSPVLAVNIPLRSISSGGIFTTMNIIFELGLSPIPYLRQE